MREENLAAITIKLGSALLKYRPTAVTTAKFVFTVSADTSASQLVGILGIPADQSLMIIVNGDLVPAPARDTCLLVDGDAVSLMTPIHAG